MEKSRDTNKGDSGGGSAERELLKLRRSTRPRRKSSSESPPESFFLDPVQYEPYLDELMEKVKKRERRLGRYNPITSLAYASLGSTYHSLKEPRAVAMYRTEYRIESILYGDKINGPIKGAFLQVLQERQLSDAEVLSIQRDVSLSTRYELEGDWFRRYGRRQQALIKYHAAARIEESSFGRDNPDLTFLWRKMACLSAIKRRLDSHDDVNLLLDFEKADRVGSDWMKESRKFLSSSICSMIRRGDEYFGMLLYTHAIGEYFKASSGALAAVSQYHENHTIPTTVNKHGDQVRPNETPTTQQLSEESSRQQQQTAGNRPDLKNDDRTHRGRQRHLEWIEFGGVSPGAAAKDESRLGDGDSLTTNVRLSPETYPKWRSLLSAKAVIESDEQPSRSNMLSSRRLDKYATKPIRDATPMEKSELPIKQDSSEGVSTQSVIGKQDQGDQDASPAPNRPQSDSYLAKIRRKMGRKSQRNTKMNETTVRTGKSSPFLAELSAAMKSISFDPPANGSGARKRDSSPYGMMASPPMTPYTPATRFPTVSGSLQDSEQDRDSSFAGSPSSKLPSVSIFDD